MIARTSKARLGHTLLEVIIAAAVLTIASLGIMAGLSGTKTVTTSSEDYLNASTRVEQAMEAVLALPFDQFLSDVANNPSGQPTFSIDDMNLPDPNIGSFVVTPVLGTNNGVYEITAIADFPGSPGRPAFRVEMTTRRSSR